MSKERLALACQLFTNRSLCYFNLNQHAQAVEDADYVISYYDPKNAKAFFRKGLSLAKLGQTDKAIKELTQASKIEPDNELYANELKNLKKKK
jgi:peptidyl-prolyl isomerase D